MNLTDKKKGAFVGTDPDAELNIYIFDQYVKNIIIKKHDRTSGWRSKMGAVHIGQYMEIYCKEALNIKYACNKWSINLKNWRSEG